jgi:GGDEF domain-containing protein
MTAAIGAMIDAETGLLTREPLVDRLEQEVARGERYGLLCALVLVRVSGYHRLLNEDPSKAGRVLERMTWLIRLGSRRYDIGCRWSEDTFGMLLPHVGKSGAAIRVQRMEKAAKAANDGQPAVDLEPVILAFPESGATAEELIAEAEKRLGVR